MAGPLADVKVIEFAALGPAPMGAMLLADLGADVLTIERKSSAPQSQGALFDPVLDVLRRNRKTVAIDLKNPEGIRQALHLVSQADVLIEGFRPQVMERLGLGPEPCVSANPGLVYARMTGWGQEGPWAQSAGHDINYLALTGALHAIGPKDGKPVVPLNLVADGGGGAMFLAMGVLAALTHARSTGTGQVVDVAMTDGSALLMSMMHTLKAMGQWSQNRASNLLDGGAHFYDTYRCRDGKYVAVGAIEPQFYALLLQGLNATELLEYDQWDRSHWPEMKTRLAEIFASKTRDEWCEVFNGSDACVAPVLDMDEASMHPHNVSRGVFTDVDGVVQAAPGPRFSATPAAQPSRPQPAESRGTWNMGSDA